MYNSSQSNAISHKDGPMLVLAGPGSGKTLVITQRIKYLIEKCDINPDSILVITFTKAAAVEMQQRFIKNTEGNNYNVNFGTFHSIFFRILKQTYKFDSSSIILESEKTKYLKSVIKNVCPSINEELIPNILSEIGKIKNSGIDVSEYESEVCKKEDFRKIYDKYKWTMLQYKKVDFDDMVLLCLRLLRERPKVLEYWQSRFKYILIDEFQDINPLQYEVVKLLSKPEDNLFIVGDDDQAIYGFRGSNPDIMLNFKNDFINAQEVLLDVNYRCTKPIVDNALKLINHNNNRFYKEIKCNKEKGSPVQIMGIADKHQEALNIITLIKQYMSIEGSSYKDIAIICRTNSSSSFILDEFVKEKIPFYSKEKIGKFYDNQFVSDIIAYIKYSKNTQDIDSLLKIMNKPVRYIERSSIVVTGNCRENIMEYYKDKNYVLQNVNRFYNDMTFLKNMSPFAAVNFIRKGIGYDEYVSNISEEAIDILDDLQEKAKHFENLSEWIEYIENFDDNMEKAIDNHGECVNIVTMHGSKGLEWPVVIIPDINEGNTPHKKASTDNEIEEERRMFYVAMTRAKEHLFMFYVEDKKKIKAGYCLPSRFINEIEE